MAQPSVYIETTIVSYLAARLSRDMIVAAHQQITHDWWDERRSQFQLVSSPLVRREATLGNPAAAARRAELLSDVALLEVTSEATALARELVARGRLPQKAEIDATHIAVAATHRIDYLMTWNCRHIANAEIQGALIRTCDAKGFKLPILCTPEQLMGVEHDD